MEAYMLNNKQLMMENIVPALAGVVQHLAEVFEDSPESEGCVLVYDECAEFSVDEWYHMFSRDNWAALSNIEYDTEDGKLIFPEDDDEGAMAFKNLYECAVAAIVDKTCGDMYNEGLLEVSVGKDGEMFYTLTDTGKEYKKNNIGEMT